MYNDREYPPDLSSYVSASNDKVRVVEFVPKTFKNREMKSKEEVKEITKSVAKSAYESFNDQCSGGDGVISQIFFEPGEPREPIKLKGKIKRQKIVRWLEFSIKEEISEDRRHAMENYEGDDLKMALRWIDAREDTFNDVLEHLMQDAARSEQAKRDKFFRYED